MKTSDKLSIHVEEDCSYFLRCSECEHVGDSWHNREIAAIKSYEAGWRMRGARPICQKCSGAQIHPNARI